MTEPAVVGCRIPYGRTRSQQWLRNNQEMTDTNISAVHQFWNLESCGEIYAEGDTQKARYEAEARNRYELEPYIKEFARFEEFRGKDVLEIGVGMGSDHSSIASSSPLSLTGVDLTERAIEHTRERFNILGLSSNLKVDNAESLSFDDERFDAIYSWGVLHHSPNTAECFNEVWRVLRAGGEAKIMIYHKHSPTGWMLWLRYGLLRLRPFTSLKNIYAEYLESPGTKAYTIEEAKALCHSFSQCDVRVQLCFGDLLEGQAGQRHRGPLLTIAKKIYPRPIIRALAKVFPIGLFLLIVVKK